MFLNVLAGIEALGFGFAAVSYASHQWLTKKCNGENIYNRNIIVQFRSKDAENDYFSSFPTIFRDFNLHWQNHTEVIYKDVSSVEEMDIFLDKMKGQNNRINGLWIQAHGFSHGFSLGKNDIYNTDMIMTKTKERIKKNTDQLKNVFEKLDEDATIILGSCHAGNVNSERHRCVGQTIASLAPGRTVIASNKTVSHFGIDFKWNEKGKMSCRFLSGQFSNAPDYEGKLKNLYYRILRIFSLCNYGVVDSNTTTYFKAYSKKDNV
jgi:hypothetical protein